MSHRLANVKQVSASIRLDEYAKLEAHAEEQKISMSELVRAILRAAVQASR